MSGMFWGPSRLERELATRIRPFCKDRIASASYRLSIGREIYVSPTADAVDPSKASVVRLKEREGFSIPPGQFAFLLTEEEVSVRCQEIAFISIRASTKFRGLVNVSGFHVDPLFKGHLTFAVFNAGPTSVHLRQGDPVFLIWYADLTDAVTKSRPPGPDRIQSEWIAGVGAGRLHSLTGLANEIGGVEQRLERRLEAVKRELVVFRVLAGIVGAALLTTLGYLVRPWLG